MRRCIPCVDYDILHDLMAGEKGHRTCARRRCDVVWTHAKRDRLLMPIAGDDHIADSQGCSLPVMVSDQSVLQAHPSFYHAVQGMHVAALEMLELAAISGVTETFLTAFQPQHPLTGVHHIMS